MLLVVLLASILVNLVAAQDCSTFVYATGDTLRDAIASARDLNAQLHAPIVLVLAGNTYGLDDGSGTRIGHIEISFPLTVIGNASTIDCNYLSGGFLIHDTDFTINNVTFTRCVAARGGALNIENSHALISSSAFLDNHATYGGALHASGNAVVMLHDSSFVLNDASQGGGAVYAQDAATVTGFSTGFACNVADQTRKDISCAGTASLMLDDTASASGVGCSNLCSVSDANAQPLCGRSPLCASPAQDQGDITDVDVVEGDSCGDGTCDYTTESCLTCASDCSCLLNGLRYDILPCAPAASDCPPPSSSTILYVPNTKGTGTPTTPAVGQFTGNFTVAEDGEYFWNVQGENVGARLSINTKMLVNAYFQQSLINSTGSIFLEAGQTNIFFLEFFSYGTYNINATRTDFPSYTRYLQYAVGYSLQLNNFGGSLDSTRAQVSRKPIRAVREAQEKKKLRDNTEPACGDGKCQEVNPNLCIHDCWQQITPVCSAQAPPPPVVGPYNLEDSIGSLLKNQYLYRLPGLDIISHGVDIVSGEPLPTPLFSFNFCDNTSLRIIQDSYRGLTYTVPKEVFASMNTKCAFDTDSEVFSSAASMALETANSYSLAASLSLQGKYASISGAYSQEKSVEAAQEMEQSVTGSIVRTQVQCEISRVMMAQYTFHPQFLRDVSQALNVSAMLTHGVQKYGTQYYKTAILGGKLVQVSYVDSSVTSSLSSEDITQNSEINFAASVSAPVFQAQASVSYSQDTSQSAENQGTYSNGTTSSTVITYGGPPGSYGPSSDSGVNTFGEWASYVDLLPVPISYELGAIGDIIPDSWITPDGLSVKGLWAAAEDLYYTSIAGFANVPSKQITNYTLHWHFDNTTPRPGNAYNMTQVSLFDNTNASFSTILMSQNSADSGSYAPALWFGAYDASPLRTFNFSGDRLGPVQVISASFSLFTGQTQTAEHNMNIADVTRTYYVLLFDWANSLFYNFTTVYSDPDVPEAMYLGTAPLPNIVTIYFTATLTTSNWVNPSNSDDTADYDHFTIYVHTQQDDIMYTNDMSTWPSTMGTSAKMQISIPLQNQVVGSLLSVTMQTYNTRAITFDTSTLTSTPASFNINAMWATHTVCNTDYTMTNCDASDLVSEMFVSSSATQPLSRSNTGVQFSLGPTTGSPIGFLYDV